MIDIGTKIKIICKQQRMTQKDLAQKIGMSEAGLGNIIRTGSPTLTTIKKIADGLGVDPLVLLMAGEEEQPSNKKELHCPHCGKTLEILLKA